MPAKPRHIAILAASTCLLGGCGNMGGLNVLAAIDGPYVPPSERASRQPVFTEVEPQVEQETAAELALPTLEPQEAVALGVEEPEVELVAVPLDEPEPEPEPKLALLEVPANTAAEGAVISEEVIEHAGDEEPLVTAFADFVAEQAVAEVANEAEALVLREDHAPPSVSSAETATLVAAEPPAAIAVEAPEITEQEITSVSAGFLPPEVAAPSTPIPASVSTAFIGPVLTREEEQPAQLATRLPSAFDYTAPAETPEIARRPVPAAEAEAQTVQAAELPPAVQTEPEAVALATAPEESDDLQGAAGALGYSVVGALPTPGSTPGSNPAASSGAQTARAANTTSAGWAYLGFYQFALSKLEEAPAGGGRESMLLLDPPSLDPELQKCGNLPPAVLIDLDPANGLLPLVSSNRASPELAGYLANLRQRGITVYWISGHGPDAARRIRQRLVESALDPDGIDPLIVTRFAGESKQQRRYALGESNCLLAILGDHRGDFDELYDFVLDPIMAGPLEVHVGEGWFIAPPPLD